MGRNVFLLKQSQLPQNLSITPLGAQARIVPCATRRRDE
jgi:hypothetical protein